MSIEQKLEEIESITSQTTELLGRVLELSQDANWEVRYRAIEFIQESSIIDTIKRVRQCLYDSNELIRTVCLEVLGEVQDELSVKNIENLLSDEDFLVRGAAAISLGEIGISSVIDKLLSQLLVEEDDEVKISIYSALYSLGQDVYLENLLDGLNNEYYRVRCASANLLASVINKYNSSKILDALSSALQKEETIAALSSINNAIKHAITTKTNGVRLNASKLRVTY